MHIAILNEVTLELEKELEDTRNKLPLYAAIDNYHGRIENLILSQENQDDQEDWAALKLLILSIESDGLEQAYEEGNISNRAYRVYQRYLKNIEQGINRKLASRLTYYFLVSLRILRFLLHEVLLSERPSVAGRTRSKAVSVLLIMTKLQSSILPIQR